MATAEQRAAEVEAALRGETCEWSSDAIGCRRIAFCEVIDGRLHSDTYSRYLSVCPMHARAIWAGGGIKFNGDFFFISSYDDLSRLIAQKLDEQKRHSKGPSASD